MHFFKIALHLSGLALLAVRVVAAARADMDGAEVSQVGRDAREAEMRDGVGQNAVASPHSCCGPCRNCSRIFPVEVTTYASLDKIKAAVAPLIERELPAGEEEPSFTVGRLVHPPSLLTLCCVCTIGCGANLHLSRLRTFEERT